jgi:hypothetical protein
MGKKVKDFTQPMDIQFYTINRYRIIKYCIQQEEFQQQKAI